MEKQYLLSEYIHPEEFEYIKKFSQDKETPFLLINLNKVEEKYDELRHCMPFAKIYYAIKANPNNEVLKVLNSKGSCFDIATIYELDKILALGASPERISYGNTIKKEKDIAYAYKKGVRLFATDSESDLNKICRQAPGSKVFFRLLADGSGADWPLSRKFGAHPDMIFRLALKCKKMNLIPYGLSFHVGSQQRDIGQWDDAIARCRYLFTSLEDADISLKMINLGGGLPAKYLRPTPSIETYTKEITRFLKEDFGENLPEILIEPGRSIVGEAGVIVSEVIMISQKSTSDHYSWVYLDVGKFGGLIETMDEAIKYPIFTDISQKKLEELIEVILAGPTCDSMDILYEKFRYRLDKNIKEGDKVFIFSTGAYTASYSSIEFNGIPPLRVYTARF
ncbi:MAG TPA: type III PLP-dependent enzyme [Candidatus Paceibacterota bacterium]|nr:type III PLP-dependent enzyme [Candidatus Paceibacterota bacterium]